MRRSKGTLFFGVVHVPRSFHVDPSAAAHQILVIILLNFTIVRSHGALNLKTFGGRVVRVIFACFIMVVAETIAETFNSAFAIITVVVGVVFVTPNVPNVPVTGERPIASVVVAVESVVNSISWGTIFTFAVSIGIDD